MNCIMSNELGILFSLQQLCPATHCMQLLSTGAENGGVAVSSIKKPLFTTFLLLLAHVGKCTLLYGLASLRNA